MENLVVWNFICSFAKDLLFYADHVPTVSTQLSILSSVKAATPEDRTVSSEYEIHLTKWIPLCCKHPFPLSESESDAP